MFSVKYEIIFKYNWMNSVAGAPPGRSVVVTEHGVTK